MEEYDTYLLTIREAAKYFHIGEKRLRRIIRADPTADFFVMVGNRYMINKRLFEKQLDKWCLQSGKYR